MHPFKLIAIVPLQGTDIEFCKNLLPGTPYPFYNGYTFDIKHGKILSISKENQYQESELYNLENGLKLNISAVVGGNGSGKSTLFELLYYVIYRISSEEGGNGGQELLQNAVDELMGQLRFLLESRMTLANFMGRSVDNGIGQLEGPALNCLVLTSKQLIDGVYMAQLIKQYNIVLDTTKISNKSPVIDEVLRQLANAAGRLEKRIRYAQLKEELLRKKFNVSLIYENAGHIYEISCCSGNIDHYMFEGKNKAWVALDLKKFCYTISLNYSHHGLNSQIIGEWITRLFHKNDAYRTPLVISPMRTNGDYEINKELRLSRERLMTSLAYELVRRDSYKLLDKYTLINFIFTPKKAGVISPPYGDKDFTGLKSAALLKKAGVKAFSDSMLHVEKAVAYIEDKMFRIGDHYEDLVHAYGTLEEFIWGENTHATKKIKQTLLYLKRITNEPHKNLLPEPNDAGEIVMTPSQLVNYIQVGNDNGQAGPMEIMEISMPGFLSVDFEFLAEDSGTVRLSWLSSGEQQMIFNIHTLLYHIYNLASVHKGKRLSHNTGNSGMENRPSYPNISILLDEIELYYHPDMQRRLISNLVNSFEHMAKPSELGIESINICILTHSPFVLSDIPVQNTLRLNNGKPAANSGQTFAANIHELLRNDFFLGSFMGNFAKEKIQSVIESMDAAIQLKKIAGHVPAGFAHPGYDPETNKIKIDREACERIISLVGEQVLYVSLMQMYSEAFGGSYIEDNLEKLRNER